MELPFRIGWDESADDVPAVVRRGRIAGPDDLDEAFLSPLRIWSSADYERQWREGVERIVGGEDSSGLVVRLERSPRDGSFVGEWFPVWRQDDIAVFRNQLVLPETVPGFDPLDPYRSVGRRYKGDLSEWQVSISALELFLTTAD